MVKETEKQPIFHRPTDLKEKLSAGIFVNDEHLRSMIRISSSLALDTPYPTAFRTIQRILGKLCEEWEEFPLTVENASKIEEKLKKPLIELVDGVINRTDEKILGLIDNLTTENDLLNDPSLNES